MSILLTVIPIYQRGEDFILMKPFSKLGLSEIFVWNVKPYLNLLFTSKCHLSLKKYLENGSPYKYYPPNILSRILIKVQGPTTNSHFVFIPESYSLNAEYENCLILYLSYIVSRKKRQQTTLLIFWKSATFTWP